jgi:16S rRNA (cytosine1402-N4)-methyltransferase
MRPDDYFHTTVLLSETLEALSPRAGGLYVDGRVGGGGHALGLLEAGAHVIGLDQDVEALDFAKEKRLHRFGDRFHPVQANFSRLAEVLAELHVTEVDGVLLDLGVSSWQLDTAARGFSFMREGSLDMRMDQSRGVTAADIVNTATAEELVRIFKEYGEEPNARRIAGELVKRRGEKKFETTMELALAVETVSPRRSRIHPATRVFQALRIAVNREMDALESVLGQATRALKPGGRMAIISFHSLEDRMVKEFFKLRSTAELDRPEWPTARPNPDYFFNAVTRKAVTASAEEQQSNPRSRSAKLRAVEKIQPNQASS